MQSGRLTSKLDERAARLKSLSEKLNAASSKGLHVEMSRLSTMVERKQEFDALLKVRLALFALRIA